MKYYFILDEDGTVRQKTMLSSISPAPVSSIEVTAEQYHAVLDLAGAYQFVDGELIYPE